MNRAQKEEQVAFIKDALSDVEGLVLSSVKGLTVTEVSDLRKRLHDAGIEYRVIKNTLARKAIAGSELDVLAGDFKEETAIAWSKDDPVGPAKVLVNFRKDCEKFTIKAGFNAGQRLDANGVEALSKMPSLEELRSRLLGVIQAVPAKLLAQINAPAQNIVGIVQAKKEEDEKAA
jgi:large subunit ribosomal protein L10